MSWRTLLCMVGSIGLAFGAIHADAASFNDPLNTPASLSGRAQSSRLLAVTRAGERLVAVGRLGHILISENGGETWQQVPVPVSSDLVAVRFVTAQKGWAVGHDGVVLHTADGGRSWVTQLDGIQLAKAIQAAAEKRAAAGDPEASKLLAEGKRFIEEGADKPVFDVQFLNENEGFIVGAFNLALRTRDGGKTWEPLTERTDNPKGMHLYALAASREDVYLAGERGLIRRWNSKNERFEALDSPYGGSFFGMLVKDSVLFAFGMRGNAFRSADRGETWKKLETGTTGGITAGAVLSDGRIVLATQTGALVVSADDGETFVHVNTAKPSPYFGIAPSGAGNIVLVGISGVRAETIK